MTLTHTFNLPNKKFAFDNFILNMDGSLLLEDKKINIPPKEFSVLVILLEAAGDIVTKTTLMDKVWGNADINEESLTRCIYSLRQILSKYKDHRYIEAIYGQGYRFNRPVVVISPPASQPTVHSIAILPFKMQSQSHSKSLHYSIVKGLSQYSPVGLSVFPVTLTQNCHSVKDILELMQQLQPDYYISGQSVPNGDENIIQIEIVRVKDYKLLHQESIKLAVNQPESILQGKLSHLLLNFIPGLRWDSGHISELNSLDSTMVYLRGKNELSQCTPRSLQLALKLLIQCINMSPNSVAPYCALVECYLNLAQMGLFEKKVAVENAKKYANKAVECNYNNPEALGLLGLISTIHSEHTVGDLLFKQANLSSPVSAGIKYYYGWHLFLMGKQEEALQAVNECLNQDPTHAAAAIMKLWITYYSGGVDEAITLGEKLHSKHQQGNTILMSILVLLLSLKGKYDNAHKLIQKIPVQDISGLVAINLHYAEYCSQGERALPAIREFLSHENIKQSRASLLPLTLIAHGEDTAMRTWHQLKQENNIWFKQWQQDPRLVMLL